MPRIVLTSNIAQVIAGVNARKARVGSAVAAGADELAATINEEIIPAFYPGRVARTVRAAPETYITGGYQVAVRVRRTDRLFDFYEKGTKPHYIFGNPVLAFSWDKDPYGRAVSYFAHVKHPGYEGRHKLPEVRAAVRERAREIWTAALAEALA